MALLGLGCDRDRSQAGAANPTLEGDLGMGSHVERGSEGKVSRQRSQIPSETCRVFILPLWLSCPKRAARMLLPDSPFWHLFLPFPNSPRWIKNL